MYPKVFRDWIDHRRRFDDVSVIETPVFFYGMRPEEETTVEIDRGKALVIRLQGHAEAEREGQTKLFFELNGQPRLIRVQRAGARPLRTQPKAEEGNARHVGAPMPGTVVTVAVSAGQSVVRGAPLLSLEAMKMETALAADRDGTIAAVHVSPGDVVEAKDLLIAFA
jgi:pyruvate carboxylase